ncbi:MAG: PKD domain-containing protein, partial [Flavobacteriales bacterium]|nr:PKD domain-containing protein [Flavobacteriales bacterium]
MFSNKLFRGLIAVLTLWCCTLTIQGQVQNTYFNSSNHDHYSPTPSLSVTGNTVMAGTIETAAGLDIHVIEIDPTGVIVWEQVYITPEDDRAFDIIGIDNSYLIVGLTTQNTIETALAMEIDLAGVVVNTQAYLDPMSQSGSRLLHVNRVQGDATGGGFIAAGWVGGNQLSMPKSGLLLRIDASLNFTWARFFESVSGNNDYDMCSNVIETPGKGFFVSGSSNATYGDQLVLAAQVDYGNNLSWETSWADNSGSGHYQVGASAYYDQQTEQVYQLANLSIIHHFGVNKFDVNTGVRDVFNSWRLFSNFGYANIQGFRIQESLADPNNLIIAGYMREHIWQEVDENGNNTGVTQSGSVPFQMEMPKLPGSIISSGGNPIVWDQMYLVPSPGFNIANDIYDSFSAFQQPSIYHPEMDMPSVFGNGYQLTAYRGLAVGGPYELEFIETDLNGVNPCSSAPLGFVTASVQWFDNPVIETEPLSIQGFPISISEQPGNHQFGPCPDNFGNPCTLDPVIDAAQEDCDTFHFFGVNNGVALSADVCFEWNFGDGNVSNAINPTHTYAADGVYTVCLKVWCCDDPSTAVDVCQNVIVDCCDDPVPGISWGCDGDQLIITATHNGVPASPNEYCWVWEDGTAGGTYTIPLTDCDGSYGVCIQMFCCDEDPANAATVCFDFLADCCTCEPLSASDIDFSWGPTGIDPFCPDGCSIGFNCPIIDPDIYCVEWDFGDGTTFTNPNQCPIHCFDCSGVYEVCLTVYCCEDPS